MLLTNYQKTEILFGTILFLFFYIIYLFLSGSQLLIWDIIWCTLSVFIILTFRFFYLNYNLLQSQNLILTL